MQLNIRISPETRRQLDALTTWYGESEGKTISRLIEREYQRERRRREMEIIIYKVLIYLPLVVLGVPGKVILWVAVFSTLIGHLNHANLKISWGPLRYVFNSPHMHVWHHDVELHGPGGQNFGVVFSLWDWLFGTAYWPAQEQPARLGFARMDLFPGGLAARFLYPFWKARS